jgi:probable phosphoglycerate mutase
MPKSFENNDTCPIVPEVPFSFLFVRHGETDPNREGIRCGGDRDVPLTQRGCAHIRQLGKVLGAKDLGIEVIICSDLMRTRQTAQILNEFLGNLPLHVEPLFNERHLGEWNGKTIAETEPLLRAGITPPGGESEAEYYERVARAFTSIIAVVPRRLIIVGSKGTARMLCKILGGKIRLNLENAAVVEFAVYQGRGGENELQITSLA